MEYRHLRFFALLAEELNFTHAAARLRVAQPHLSREIIRLERELGVPLFARDRRRVALTPAGSAFLEHAHRILAVTADAVQAAQRADRGETGLIRVGFSSSAGFGVLPKAVRQFRLLRPDVEVVLTEFNSDQQPDLLRGGTLDACLLYPPRRPEQDLATETLTSDPLVIALPEDHPFAGRARIPLKALETESWIFFRRSVASRLHDEILGACGRAGFSPHVVQEALKLATIASLVAGGLGISLVPVTLSRLRLPGAVYRPISAPVPQVPLSLMWRRKDANPALPPFLETVRSEARRFTAEGGWQGAAGLPADAVRATGHRAKRGTRSGT